MDWLKKHGDTIAILAVFAGCFWNLNEKVNQNFNDLRKDVAGVEREVAIIKTVLLMKNIMPQELCKDQK